MPIPMRAARPLALILAGSVLTPMLAFGAVGCGNSGGGTTAPAPTTVATNNAPAPGSGAPMMAGGASPAAQPQQQHAGLTTKQKVILLAGAALLYYLYKKHQEAQQNAAASGQTASATGAQPQLYRSSNGGIYYRKPDAQHTVVWLTAPSSPVAVPADQVNQYAPDYQQYQGQAAPAAPTGQQTQSATQYDPSLSTAQ